MFRAWILLYLRKLQGIIVNCVTAFWEFVECWVCVEKPAEYDGSLNAKYENAVAVFSVDCRMDYFLNNDLFVYMKLSAFFLLFLTRPWTSVMMKKKERQNKRRRSHRVKEERKSKQIQMHQVSEYYRRMLSSCKLFKNSNICLKNWAFLHLVNVSILFKVLFMSL